MAREKPYYREVLADLQSKTNKSYFGVNEIKKLLNVGYDMAKDILDGETKISIYQLASRLLG